MSAKNYLTILKWGSWLSPLVLLLVFSNLLFPYITSKQLVFNVLMEVMLFFWLMLVIKYPEYRPRRSIITYGLITYFLALLISSFVGVDFNLSFFGNAERMLGWFHLFHFFIFYLIIITVWRELADWRRFLDIAIGVSVIIVFYGLKQGLPASLLGNAAYTAALMLFALGFTIYQSYECYLLGGFKGLLEKYHWVYLAAIPVLFYGLVTANISGAFAGLVAGLLVSGLLLVFGKKSKRRRFWGTASIIAFILILTVLFFNRNSDWLANSRMGLALKDFSSSNPTWNTRLISWRAAYLDFKEHPIFGVGLGNYAFIFDYYFEPHFTDYSPNETYFDRAHNNIVEVASTAGTLGLIAYLSIFVASGYYLYKAYQKRKIKLGELAILSGIITAYFVQNLALFDALVTYLMFFGLLGLIYYYYQDHSEIVSKGPRLIGPKELILGVVIAVPLLTIIWLFNIRGFIMFDKAIKGYSAISQGDVASGLNDYRTSVDLAPYNRDSRSTLINLIAGNPRYLTYLSQATATELLDYTLSLGEENVKYNPYDSMMNSQLAKIANLAARYNYRDLDKLNKYSSISVKAIEQAIASSPGRYPLYFIRADVFLTRGDKAEALASLNKIKELKPDNQEVNCQLANTYFFFEDYKPAYELAARCAIDDKAQYLSYTELIKQAADEQIKLGNTAVAAKLNGAIKK